MGLVALFAACGGKVNFVEGSGGDTGTGNSGTGNTGTGNSGTGNSGTGATGTGGTGATGTGGTGNTGNAPPTLEQVCSEACEGVLGSDCYLPQDCYGQCVNTPSFDCRDPWIEVIQCIDEGDSCQFPPECEKAIFEWDECETGGCQQECFQDDGFGCGCYYDCGPDMFETYCYDDPGSPNQPTYCDCYIGGGYVGSCSGGVNLVCDVWDSCCSQYWAVQPG